MKKLLRLISVATMLLAATTFMACSSDDDDDDSGARSVSARNSGSVVGVVLDNKGAPVDGATVTLGGKSVTTNKGGEFEITGVNPNDKALITARKANATTSTATDGTSGGSLTTTSSETALQTGTGSSVASGETAYKLTVTKDGYLPGTITGVYVTYTETEEQEVTRANALLHGLQYDYQDVLKAYAASLAQSNTIATTTTTATEDTTATTTTQTGSDADRVFKDLSEAISALKNMYKTGSYTEYFSTFGTSSALIPLDATLKGSLMLNTTSKEGTTWAETTYKPTSKPTIHVSYKSSTSGADYTWSAQADDNGIFEFKEKLPSGVELTISVDSFQETIESNDYWFSSESMIVLVDNSGAETTSGVKKVTLGSKDVNSETYRFLLFAQNDKLWVTKTNTETTASGVLLSKNSDLTFTFNKAVKAVDIDTTSATKTTGFKNLSKDSYDAKISEDGKTVTFTPKIGYWELDTSASTQVVLSAEAVDGTTKLEKTKFPVYFDNKVWVSVKDLSYDDYNDLRKLSDPIVLVFSKPMNEKIAVNLTNNKTAYTEKWNEADADKGIEANTELTLTPDAKVGYWDIGSEKTIDITVADVYANSKDSYINAFGYWKVGADTTGSKLTVNFDNYNDVTIAKADKGFTATFAKAIKAQTESELKANLHVYNAGASYSETFAWGSATELSDVILALSDDGTTITVTPQNTEFASYGYYALSFAKDKFIARTGERIPRKPATTKTVEDFTANTTPFVTTFTLGEDFISEKVTVVEAKDVPASAKVSRVAYEDSDKYVKISFNKKVRKSALEIWKDDNGSAKATPTNWIDGNDVYLSLKDAKDDWAVILNGNVTSESGDTWALGTKGYNTGFKVSEKFFKMVASSLYAPELSIAGGKNDVDSQKVVPADGNTFTFTFDQDVSAAKWTAELYDSDNVEQKDLKNTVYGVSATVDPDKKDTVTVTVDSAKKQLDFGKKYYLSLKAKADSESEEAYVYYDSSKTDVTSTYYKAIDSSTTLGSKITKDNVNGNKRYIYFETEDKDYQLKNLYVLAANKGFDNTKTSKTTSFEEFAKSIQSDIVLEFNNDIADIISAADVYLVNDEEHYTPANGTTAASGWLKKDDVEKKNTYAATATVAGKVLTVKPTYAFPTESKVYVVAFDKNGDRIYLKNVAGTQYFKDGDTGKPYTSAKSASDIEKVLTNAAASTATKLNLAVWTTDDKRPVANGQSIVFTFKPALASTVDEVNYGKYTLYQKKQILPASASKWVKVGEYTVGGTGAEAIKYVKTTVTTVGTTTTTTYSYPNAAKEDIAIRAVNACIEATLPADEFYYKDTAEFRLVCAEDNVEIYSEILSVKANNVLVDGNVDLTALSAVPADPATETPIATDGEKVISVKTTSYLKSVTKVVKGENGKGTKTAKDNPNNRVTNNKVTAELDGDSDGKTIKVTIPKDETACQGDILLIDVEDVVGTKATVKVELK